MKRDISKLEEVVVAVATMVIAILLQSKLKLKLDSTTPSNDDMNSNPRPSSVTTHQHLHLIQSVAVSIILTQLSDQTPLVYPLIQPTWSGNTNRKEEDADAQDAFPTNKGRRLSVEHDDGTLYLHFGMN